MDKNYTDEEIDEKLDKLSRHVEWQLELRQIHKKYGPFITLKDENGEDTLFKVLYLINYEDLDYLFVKCDDNTKLYIYRVTQDRGTGKREYNLPEKETEVKLYALYKEKFRGIHTF